MPQIEPIAHIRNDFPEKFGVPRQSGLVPQLQARIVFEPKYRNADALRGLEAFSHIWLLWDFSESREATAGQEAWRPTVRPPRLGGNKSIGVFATRSPFRPNHIGLSCVRLESIEQTGEEGCVLKVSGADLMDGTPIFDIKPYIRYTDSQPDARCGFVDKVEKATLEVCFPDELLQKLPDGKRQAAIAVLQQDPRPAYQHDSDKTYGLPFAGFDIRFRVEESGEKAQATVTEVLPYTKH